MPVPPVASQSFNNQLKTDFFNLQTRENVAMILGVSDRGLRHLLYATPRDSLYYNFEIQKKNGGTRKITSPVNKLKTLQKRLLRVLSAVYIPKNSAHGFVKTRGICTNSRQHLKRRNVLNIDLEDFFPTINFGRVRGMFMAAPYNRSAEVATVLAQICCYNNELPQGAPTSPIISNMICVRLDSHLTKLSAQHHCRYTRYADDITISSRTNVFPKELAEPVTVDGQTKYKAGKSVKNTIKNNGFKINPGKTRLQKSNERQSVTGLVINKKVNIPREFVRNVRAMLYNWETKGIAACQTDFSGQYAGGNQSARKKLFKETLRGKIDFIGTVRGKDDAIYLKFLQRLADLDKTLLSSDSLNKLRQFNDRFSHVLDNLFVIETTATDDSDCSQGTGFYLEGIGVVTCAHVLVNNADCLIEIYRRDESDRQFAGLKKNDAELDLAILSMREYPAETFSISGTEPKQGDQIYLAGFPYFGPGHTGIVEAGYVIGVKRDVDDNPRILISASIISGNSGGPVFDADWNIIGIAAKGIESQNQTEEKPFYEVIPIESLIQMSRVS